MGAQGVCVRVIMAAKKAGKGKKKAAKKKIAKKGKKKAAKKPTKKRRKAKKKPISKRAAVNRVWRGKLAKSKGGLAKSALMKNKSGRIVSKKQSARGQKNKYRRCDESPQGAQDQRLRRLQEGHRVLQVRSQALRVVGAGGDCRELLAAPLHAISNCIPMNAYPRTLGR